MDDVIDLDPWHRMVRPPNTRWVPWLLRRVKKNQGFILVAEVNETTAGVVIAWTIRYTGLDRTLELPTKIGYLCAFSVRPPWRSKGIGTRLLRECERRFQASGCDQLRLSTFAHNRKALHFYAREGFEVRYVVLGKQQGPPKHKWPAGRGRSRRARLR